MNLSPLAYYSARPTLRIDGQDHDMAATLLQSLVMREQEGGLSSLELAFVNFGARDGGEVGLAFEDERVLRLGSSLKAYAGEAAAPTEIFAGVVSALEFAFDSEGPPRLLVQAEDAAQKARMARRIAVYEQKSVADIVRELAARMGLTPVVTGLDAASALEVQADESDLAFLRRLLRRHGADLQVVGSELQVAARRDVQRNQLTLRLHGQLHKLRVVADLAHQVTQVQVSGFDPAQGAAVQGSAGGAAPGPGRGRTGPELLRQAFGERVQHSAHRLALSQAEADALAQAEFEQRARRFVTVEGVCEGNPALRVGTHLTLAEVSPRFDNTYYVTACTHRYDMRRGYETEFQAEGAHLGDAA
ncbi:phage late control D family protein [Azohydromonas aeria]|uniref:phage late control D family protein n=1 Tax=Azohydromonas aeria TaxID=2590212 RepID=UPI0012FAED11|nr:contractile injection system protein, VgrG/Pvc8 family [Azohydromonas aeria]